MMPTSVEILDTRQSRARINERLHDFLATKRQDDCAAMASLAQHVDDFLTAGGKRIRPLLCLLGWHATGSGGDFEPIVGVAASLELFHAFALIHDDIMDASDTRRGKPTLHRALEAIAPGHLDQMQAQRWGLNVATLVGDLVLTWSDEMLHAAGLTQRQLVAVTGLLNCMRTEVMLGQYFDLCTTGHPTADVGKALRTVRFKTAKYTIERPLQIGSTLAGRADGLLDLWTDYAIAVGETFQLRDDLLGVFGDPARTGKSAVEDLRDGKATVLMACAVGNADSAQRKLLLSLVGNRGLDEDGARTVRELLVDTGAVDAVESMIADRTVQAHRLLDRAPVASEVKNWLREFATHASNRNC